jgi:hypothetical protein
MDDAHDANYCLVCLAAVTRLDPACPGCGASFAGAGAYVRIAGVAPARPVSLRALSPVRPLPEAA